MKIDLKWGLPFVMPFAVLALFRLIWLAAGAPWDDPSFAALMSLLFGVIGGTFAAGAMDSDGIHWHVTIGRRK